MGGKGQRGNCRFTVFPSSHIHLSALHLGRQHNVDTVAPCLPCGFLSSVSAVKDPSLLPFLPFCLYSPAFLPSAFSLNAVKEAQPVHVPAVGHSPRRRGIHVFCLSFFRLLPSAVPWRKKNKKANKDWIPRSSRGMTRPFRRADIIIRGGVTFNPDSSLLPSFKATLNSRTPPSFPPTPPARLTPTLSKIK